MADILAESYLARGRPLNPSYGKIGKTLADMKREFESEVSEYPSGGAKEALERVRISH